PFLLHGVTGSGKTDVYLGAAASVIAAGGQVLVLVPEINLTPQFEARVRAALPERVTVTMHSGLADGARRSHWLAASNGEADLVLGTRLAVFCPMPRLALVVIDEEQDGSYKQQDGVRYHARDVGVWAGRAGRLPERPDRARQRDTVARDVCAGRVGALSPAVVARARRSARDAAEARLR